MFVLLCSELTVYGVSSLLVVVDVDHRGDAIEAGRWHCRGSFGATGATLVSLVILPLLGHFVVELTGSDRLGAERILAAHSTDRLGLAQVGKV